MFADMTKLEDIILVVLLSLLAICIIILIVDTIRLNSKRYWERWDKKYMEKNGMNQYWDIFIKHYKEYKPISYWNEKRNSYFPDEEKLKENSLTFSWKDRYTIVVWHKNGVYYSTVHLYERNNCVLCHFNMEKSKKLAELLKNEWGDLFYKLSI